MKSFALLAGLVGMASAQLIPAAEVAAMSVPAAKSAPVGKGNVNDVVSYSSNGAFSSTYNSVYGSAQSSSKKMFRKRHDEGDCSPQPLGYGPTPSPDTDTAFLADTDFSNAANNAPTPAGWVQTFKNLQASTQGPMGYLGYDTMTSYDTNQCAAQCDAKDGCFAFNTYFERDPTLDSGVNCTNPPSTTIIKCVYWGTTIEPDTATNVGQYCADFHIVIAGSNGYVRQRANTIPGYNGTFIGGAAINAPTECNSYITYKLFNDGQPFDPVRCEAACEAETAYNAQYLNSRATCRFFDTYILLKNGVPQGQYCALYTRSWDLSYATNTGYTYNGDVYTIEYSYIYSNSSDPGAQICDATCMSQSPCPGSLSSSSTTTTTSSTKSSSTSTAVATTSVSTTKATSAITTTSSAAVTTSSTTSASTTSAAKTSTTASTTPVKTSTTSSSTTKCTTTSSTTSSSTTAKTTTSSTTSSSTTAKTTTSSTTSTTPIRTTTTTSCTTTPKPSTTTFATTTTSKTTTTTTTSAVATPTQSSCTTSSSQSSGGFFSWIFSIFGGSSSQSDCQTSTQPQGNTWSPWSQKQGQGSSFWW